MQPIYIPSVSHQNIVQILKKCNDESFVNLIRTCCRVYDVANQMEKKTRIFSHAHFSVFVYFDVEEGKVMLDVPLRLKKKDNKKTKALLWEESCTHLLAGELDEEEDEEAEMEISDETEDSESSTEDDLMDSDDDPICKLQQEEEYVMNDQHHLSHLMLRRSDREWAYYRKMAASDFCRLIEFFRFKIVTIDPYREEFGEQHSKRFLVAEEMLKIIPFARAETLKLDSLDSEELFYTTLTTAYRAFNFKGLLIHNNEEYGIIEKLNFDWNALETVEAQCLDGNAKNIYQRVIQKWTVGETNLKHLKLDIVDAVHFPQGLNNINDFLTISNLSHSIDYHYIRAYNGIRPLYAIIYWVYNVINFYDISDCDGCDCQTEFCFKKMLEIITDNWNEKGVTDWGTILDNWNNGTMEELGEALRQKICDGHHIA